MCSRLDADIISRFSDVGNSTEAIGEIGDHLIEDLKEALGKTDLAVAAQRCGGDFDGSKLTLKILGKKFGVDSVGNISSDIHVNPWIVTPFFDQISSSSKSLLRCAAGLMAGLPYCSTMFELISTGNSSPDFAMCTVSR